MQTTLICPHQTGEYPGVQEGRHIQARLLILHIIHHVNFFEIKPLITKLACVESIVCLFILLE